MELVTSDAHQGLKNAIAAVFAGASWQRCRTHFMANLLTRVPKRAQPTRRGYPGPSRMVRTIYQQLSPAEVHGQLDRVVSEVASGLNDRRPKLRRLLADPKVGYILVERRDRLARFGVGMVQAMLEARSGGLLVIEDNEVYNEVDDDLVRDMTEILTCFCARLYGRRSAANRARQAISSATE